MDFNYDLSLEEQLTIQYYQQQMIGFIIQYRQQQLIDRRRAALLSLISMDSPILPDFGWPEPDLPEEAGWEVESGLRFSEEEVLDPTPSRIPSHTTAGSGISNNQLISPEAQARMDKAKAKFEISFPYGYSIIPTSAWGWLCGWHSIIHSMEAQYPTLPCPTRDELQELFDANMTEYAEIYTMDNSNDFSGDQIARTLYEWGIPHGLNLQVGCLEEGRVPLLVSHPADEQDDALVVWIYNDANWRDDETTGHYCGMRANEADDQPVEEELPTQGDQAHENSAAKVMQLLMERGMLGG